MIEINTKLLQEYFLLNTEHNVLYNIDTNENIYISFENVTKIINHLERINTIKKVDSGLYSIDNKEELLAYIIEYVYHNIKHYSNRFQNIKEFYLFVYINFMMFLTLFSQDALKLFDYFPQKIKEGIENDILETLDAYIASYDPRAIIFFISSKFNLPYDKLLQNKKIVYAYTEPAINKKWQKQYKKEGEPIVFWFYESILGKAFFLVLYTPKCRYKMEKGGCAGCNLPTVSDSSKEVNSQDIYKQIDNTFIKKISLQERESLQELMLSNNGSILDPYTMDLQSLEYAISQSVKVLPNLKKIILETRIDNYTDIKQLQTIKHMLEEEVPDMILEIAVGFEIFDDELRNGYYKKGLDKSILEEKVKILAELNISLKVYMMYKAVPDYLMSVDEAIADINSASEYFARLASTYDVKINLHISPTYLATGTPLFVEYKNGKYTPPGYNEIKRLYDELKLEKNISYYISLNDEGLAQENESLQDYHQFMTLKEKIHQFNISNYKR